MSTQDHNIAIRILEKTYQIKCPTDMAQELQDAAVYVDNKMRQVRDSGKAVGLDRIAVITALNVAFDLLSVQKNNNQSVANISSRVRDMQKRIEESLMQYEQIEL
jgi:cell division protein ZapA